MRRAAFVLVVCLSSLVPLIVDAAGATRAAIATPIELSLRSKAVSRPLHYAVFLPAGYDSSPTRRYPVMYFLHGLPAGPTAYKDAAFVARSLARIGAESILVAPQGADSDESDPEYLDRGVGRNWETALSSELVDDVDSRFRTIAHRSGRAVLGLSAGGYGAVIMALHHPGVYSATESWSGYFHATDPTGTRSLELGSDSANARASAHLQVAGLGRADGPAPLYIAFYVGAGDTRFRAENVTFDRELSQAGVPHVFRIYPGGHDFTLWSSRADTWLGLLTRHLAGATDGTRPVDVPG